MTKSTPKVHQAIKKAAKEDLKEIGKFIKRERLRRKLSRPQFAHLCFMTGSSLKKIEEGKVDVQFLTLLKLSRGMKMDVVELVSISEHRIFL